MLFMKIIFKSNNILWENDVLNIGGKKEEVDIEQ